MPGQTISPPNIDTSGITPLVLALRGRRGGRYISETEWKHAQKEYTVVMSPTLGRGGGG